jgi:hypothetical protein
MIPKSTPSEPVSALDRCCIAWQSAYNATLAQKDSEYLASRDASFAYRRVMPTLNGQDNIRDFIACVANGMLLGAIDGNRGARLLYAAQVALTSFRTKSSRPETTAQ